VKHRILVVEDDPDALAMTLGMARVLGHWATGVSSAELAMHRFFDRGFDTIVLDVNLPGLSGLDLAMKLAKFGNLRFVFATGLPAPELLPPRAVWLRKPYSMDQLRQALQASEEGGGV